MRIVLFCSWIVPPIKPKFKNALCEEQGVDDECKIHTLLLKPEEYDFTCGVLMCGTGFKLLNKLFVQILSF